MSPVLLLIAMLPPVALTVPRVTASASLMKMPPAVVDALRTFTVVCNGSPVVPMLLAAIRLAVEAVRLFAPTLPSKIEPVSAGQRDRPVPAFTTSLSVRFPVLAVRVTLLLPKVMPVVAPTVPTESALVSVYWIAPVVFAANVVTSLLPFVRIKAPPPRRRNPDAVIAAVWVTAPPVCRVMVPAPAFNPVTAGWKVSAVAPTLPIVNPSISVNARLPAPV